jgi:Ca2+-binding RTX toxin-like protein
MAIVFGTSADETISTAQGVTEDADLVFGLAGKDIIFGNGGDDVLKGGDGPDVLNGGANDDNLIGGLAADELHGGDGSDTADYTDSAHWVQVDLGAGLGKFGTADGDTYDSIENVNGSSGSDGLYGNDRSNVLRGLDGSDVLYGFGGPDTLDGGYGDDFLRSGSGADRLIGGEGRDTADYWLSPVGVEIWLETGVGYYGDAAGDTFDGVEDLIGSPFDDDLWGDEADNHFSGESGQDILKGFDGADRLDAGHGPDTLVGGTGHDQLLGGKDIDTMEGGADGDEFIWVNENEVGDNPASADKITDFDIAQGDVIDLSAVDANIPMAGDQAFTFIGMNPLSATPGQVNYYHAGGNTYIQFQTGTTADPEGVICLTGIHNPQASWFVL